MWVFIALSSVILCCVAEAADEKIISTMLQPSKQLAFDFNESTPLGSTDLCESVLKSKNIQSNEPVSDEELDEIWKNRDSTPRNCNLHNRAAFHSISYESKIGPCTFRVDKKHISAEKWDGGTLSLQPEMKLQPENTSSPREIHYSIFSNGKKFAQASIVCPKGFKMNELNDALSASGFVGHCSYSAGIAKDPQEISR